MLNIQQIESYGKQALVPEIGARGQKEISNAYVAVVGMGGLGCPAATYLAAAGVGHLTLVDGDRVELSNLHRQPLYTRADIGSYKASTAADCLRSINPDIEIVGVNEFISNSNAEKIFKDQTLILDCVDSVSSRYIINDYAMLQGIPVVVASALGFDGQLLRTFVGRCFRCLFPPVPVESDCGACSNSGVVGASVAVMGTLQATEAIKALIGIIPPSYMLVYDSLASTMFRQVPLPDCSMCSVCLLGEVGDIPTKYKTIDNVSNNISAEEFADLLTIEDGIVLVKDTPLLDVRPSNHFNLWHAEYSVNISLDSLQSETPHIEDERFFVICRRGNASREACKVLALKGMNPVNVIGGWHAVANLPKFCLVVPKF